MSQSSETLGKFPDQYRLMSASGAIEVDGRIVMRVHMRAFLDCQIVDGIAYKVVSLEGLSDEAAAVMLVDAEIECQSRARAACLAQVQQRQGVSDPVVLLDPIDIEMTRQATRLESVVTEVAENLRVHGLAVQGQVKACEEVMREQDPLQAAVDAATGIVIPDEFDGAEEAAEEPAKEEGAQEAAAPAGEEAFDPFKNEKDKAAAFLANDLPPTDPLRQIDPDSVPVGSRGEGWEGWWDRPIKGQSSALNKMNKERAKYGLNLLTMADAERYALKGAHSYLAERYMEANLIPLGDTP